jgi:4,5-dihydroxyphthalate decarboxylase
MHMTSMFYRALWEEERAAARPNIYPLGFKRCRPELERVLRYSHRQGLTPRLYQPEELFWPSMLNT